MKIETRDFGTLELSEDAIVTFRQPIFGFEEYLQFVMIFDQEIGQEFVWLQSVQEKNLCFVMYDPTRLGEKYCPVLPDSIDTILNGNGEYECWVLASIGQKFSETTVNLKSPIVICEETHTAAQIVLEQSYPIRFPLFGEE